MRSFSKHWNSYCFKAPALKPRMGKVFDFPKEHKKTNQKQDYSTESTTKLSTGAAETVSTATAGLGSSSTGSAWDS